MKKKVYTFTALLFMASLPLSAEPPKAPTGGNPSSPAQSGSSGTAGGSSATAPAQSGSSGTASGSSATAPAKQKAQTMPFAVYTDQGARGNHYIPSGWMGDYGDLKMNPGCTQGPHSGKNCIQITYSGKMTNNAGWSGIFWQYPANNWGTKPGGFNLSGAKRLTFWARGAKGGERIAEFKVGGITGEYSDTDSTSSGPVELTPQWKQYSIDLNGKDLSNIIGAFAWAASKDENPDGFTIYLDDITFE